MKTAIVMTTINIPKVLESYCSNVAWFGHKDETEILVIGDLKTPEEARDYTLSFRKKAFETYFFDVKEQEKWLGRFSKLKDIIPYNSDNRRNVGYLMAAEAGAEVIISVDDDNYPLPEGDFVGGHQIVGSTRGLESVIAPDGWFNPCDLLETSPPRSIYPRGFPYSKRWKNTTAFGFRTARIVVNEGLWLMSPDIDAVTALNEPLTVIRVDSRGIILEQGTYSPINTQNTSFYRSILPCFYYIPMGFTYNGNKVDRYGDIWLGLFALKIIHKIGDGVTFGLPTVAHLRNKHDLLKDLSNELGGMILTEHLVKLLEEINLEKSTYSEAYVELGQKLYERVSNSNFQQEVKDYFRQLEVNMEIWVDACGKIL